MVNITPWLLLTTGVASAANIGYLPRAANVSTNATLPLSKCPGYKASNIKTTGSTLTADLSLAGTACNTYGTDLTKLTLEVVYETGSSQTFYN
jgi:alpha-glucosidase